MYVSKQTYVVSVPPFSRIFTNFIQHPLLGTFRFPFLTYLQHIDDTHLNPHMAKEVRRM